MKAGLLGPLWVPTDDNKAMVVAIYDDSEACTRHTLVLDTFTSTAPLWLYDSFTGSGDLSTHVGEIGANWVINEPSVGNVVNPNRIVLGSGVATSIAALNTSGWLIASATPPSDNYSISTTVEILDNTLVESGVELFMGTLTPVDTTLVGAGFLLSVQNRYGVNPSVDGINISLMIGDDTNGWNSMFVTNSTIADYNTPFTVRIHVTNNRKDIKVLVDDEIIYTTSLATSMAVPTKAGYFLDLTSQSHDKFVITDIKGRYLSQVPNGDLSSHVGEIGATWNLTTMTGSFIDPGASLANFTLTGTGSVTLADIRPIPTAAVYPSGAADVTGNHAIEMDFTWLTGTTMFMGFQTNGNACYFLNFYTVNGGSSIEIDVLAHNSAGTTESLDNNSYLVAPMDPGSQHTIRIEIYGPVKLIYLDNQMLTRLVDDTISTHGYPWIYMTDLPSFFTVDRFFVETLCPAGGPWLFDSFSDDGVDLVSHTPEIGSSWTRWYTFSDVNYQLVNDTLQNADYAGSLVDHRVWNQVVPPSSDYELTAWITLEQDIPTNSSIEFEFVARNAPDTYPDTGDYIRGYFQLSPATNPGSNGSTLQISTYSEGNAGYLFPASLSVTAGTHTLKMHVEGSTMTLYYDGTQVHQRTIPALALTAPGKVGFGFRTTNFDITLASLTQIMATNLS